MNDCKKVAERLSGYLDGELSQGDRQRVEVHLEQCALCRKTYDQLAELRTAVGKLKFDELSTSEMNEMINDAAVRTSRGLGWLFYVGGAVVLLVYGAYEFARDDEVPALVKTAVAALVVGVVMLFYSVFRQRQIARRTDRYEDVQI